MSGGPPHHPHGRQQPTSNPAWNHLQVPNYFPGRQLQHAHMSNEHPLLHQSTWHTPTTEPVKTMSHSHLFNLEQMISDRPFQRHAPGVDLSLQRNGNQNGEIPPSPISLSVRDTNKINSLPAGAIDIQAVELTKSLSPGIKSINAPAKTSGSPGLHSATAVQIMNSPVLKSTSPGLGKSTSPGIKSTSPGLKTSSPSLKVAASSLLTSGGHSLLSSSPGIVCTSTNLMMTPVLQTTSFGNMASPIPSQIHPSLAGSNLTITPSFFPTYGPGMKGAGPLSPGQQNNPKNTKRPTKRVDSILERLNPGAERAAAFSDKVSNMTDNTVDNKGQSVIVQAAGAGSTNDENSNSSSVMTSVRDEDVVSPYSANEDSMDSNKSRRKRKPSKTVKVTKEEERTETTVMKIDNNNLSDKKEETTPNNKDGKGLEVEELEKDKEQQRRRSGSAPPGSPTLPKKSRRKTSSESETIANIAAMVEQTASLTPATIKKEKEDEDEEVMESQETTKSGEQTSVSVSVIRRDPNREIENIKENTSTTPSSQQPVTTEKTSTIPPPPPAPPITAQKNFVEVENKLQEMFAGITDETDSGGANSKMLDFNDDSKALGLEEGKIEENPMKVENENDIPSAGQPTEAVTSTSNDISPTSSAKSNQKSRKRKGGGGNGRSSKEPLEQLPFDTSTPKKKKSNKKSKSASKKEVSIPNIKENKKSLNGKPVQNKVDNFKDVYAYDSGSNASSSKSRGPFIQIRGPRDSPLSINVINTPSNDDEPDKKPQKVKKYHDDSEYRHKVQSRGLHSSTLSTKYDAQTRDASWICVFCKRGPHATDPNLPGPSPFNIADVNVPPPGDLFGPYIITNNSPEFDRRIDDPFDKQFRSKKVARALDAAATSPSKSTSKKSKRKHTDSSSDSVADAGNVMLGITETNDKTFEVWMHEDCVVWSPGVYLIGSKIVGLEEAIWTCCNVACSRCSYKGANVFCVKRGCTNVMHIGCARLSSWHLDEDTYKATCTGHAVQ